MSDLLKNPGHWQVRAEEARLLANEVNDEVTKQMMLKIAEDYEKLAENAEFRLRGPWNGPRKVSRNSDSGG